MLQVKLLGQFDVQVGGQTLKISSGPARLLFIYLILHPDTAVRRERLAGVFWPESSEGQSRTNLRHALWRLRKSFQESALDERNYLQSDDETIRFDPPPDCWIDVAILGREVDKSISIDDLAAMLAVYQGELLPGFYEDWIVRERDRIQAVYEQKMHLLLEKLLGSGRWAEALEWGERWIARGQVPEQAYRALMIAHSHLDDLSSVAAVYQRLAASLQQELGVEPARKLVICTNAYWPEKNQSPQQSHWRKKPRRPRRQARPPSRACSTSIKATRTCSSGVRC